MFFELSSAWVKIEYKYKKINKLKHKNLYVPVREITQFEKRKQFLYGELYQSYSVSISCGTIGCVGTAISYMYIYMQAVCFYGLGLG